MSASPKQLSTINNNNNEPNSVLQKFDDGSIALWFGPPLHSGFAYYPSGRVAVVVSNVNNYQNRFYFYDDDMNNSLLGAFDEYAHGFAYNNTRKSKKRGERICLVKVGGIISDEKGDIIHEWKWDPASQNAGAKPSTTIIIELNEFLTLHFNDRIKYSLKYNVNGITKEFDLSMKVRRIDRYTDSALRVPGRPGMLQPIISHTTLIERHNAFTEEMKAFRNTLNPKSDELSLVKDIVKSLEHHFDDYDETSLKVKPWNQHGWKEDALSMTRCELPQVVLTDTEKSVDNLPGLGDSIFLNAERVRKEGLEKVKTFKIRDTLIRKDGKGWKSDLDLRLAIMNENPLLERTKVLCNASGRYCSDLIVPRGKRSASNPTGKAEPIGKRLPIISGRNFEDNIKALCGPDQLTLILFARNDIPESVKAEKICEILNFYLAQQDESERPELSGTSKLQLRTKGRRNSITEKSFQIVKCDMNEDRSMVKKYNILTLPHFMMYYNGKMVYQGTMGGKAYRTVPNWKAVAPRILLVEPVFKQQINTEKYFRKRRWHWDLCMNANEASQRRAMLAESSMGLTYDVIMISDAVPNDEVAKIEKIFKIPGGKNKVIICGMVHVSGEEGAEQVNSVKWKKGVTTEVGRFVPDLALGRLADCILTKPVKGTALDGMIAFRDDTFCNIDNNASAKTKGFYQSGVGPPQFIGLTPDSLFNSMVKGLMDGRQGRSMTHSFDTGMTLSASETEFKGIPLRKESMEGRSMSVPAF